MEAGRRDAGNRKILSQINVTPFVDVMLVLLIIFMVTAPMLETGVDVELPEAQAAALEKTQEPLVITVDRDGGIYLGRFRVETLEKLIPVLSENLRGQGDKAVFLEADGKIPYETVVQIMAAAQEAGAQRVGMVSRPPQE